MLEKPAPAEAPIHELMVRRWSPRAFDPARPVPRELLKALLEAARWAPSCNGDEPWRYLVWDRMRDPQGFAAAFDCLSENNKKWVKNVPLLMLSCAGSLFQHNGKPNRWAQHDTGMASLAMALQAVAAGLALHQMGGFDVERARAAFGIPPEYTPMAMIAVGYQAAPETIEDPEVRKKELAPRARKPLAERFFEGGWGRGIAF
jgi:nitroreductase